MIDLQCREKLKLISTNEVIATVDIGNLILEAGFLEPTDIAITPDGSKAYVVTSDVIVVIDLELLNRQMQRVVYYS